jgi:tRNA pseudouridine55 synthase
LPALLAAIDGLLLLDKPAGPTSHDAVAWARRTLGTRRVGHCGTLDPAATGLLLLTVGEALRWQDRFTAERKTYRGRLRLGIATDTDDLAGKAVREDAAGAAAVTEQRLREAFAAYTGAIDQRVPLYSAVKVGGRKLYELARRGEPVVLPSRRVEILRFELTAFEPPEAAFFVECSKGAYVRSLARDVGETLGCGAALAALCRESVGPFRRSEAVAWDGNRDPGGEAVRGAILPLQQALARAGVAS